MSTGMSNKFVRFYSYKYKEKFIILQSIGIKIIKSIKKLEFFVLVETTIKASSWDEIRNEYMNFNPYFSQVYSEAKVDIDIKIDPPSLCFISAACFNAFYCSLY